MLNFLKTDAFITLKKLQRIFLVNYLLNSYKIQLVYSTIIIDDFFSILHKRKQMNSFPAGVNANMLSDGLLCICGPYVSF